MDNKLKNTLCGILQWLGLISDWVVEQGQSNAWTFRKWNSGIAECWGTTANYTAITNYFNGNYYVDVQHNYPSGLFISAPSVIASREGANGTAGLVSATVYENYSNYLRVTLWSAGTSRDYANWGIALYAKGLWKQFVGGGTP